MLDVDLNRKVHKEFANDPRNRTLDLLTWRILRKTWCT